MAYISDRFFKIWIYSVSHSTLLLRSINDQGDDLNALQKGYNIDIEFTGLGHIDLPVILKGLKITEIQGENIPGRFRKYSRSLGYKVFEINSEKNYYVVASGYVVGKNNWVNEDRVLNPYLEYDEVITSS